MLRHGQREQPARSWSPRLSQAEPQPDSRAPGELTASPVTGMRKLCKQWPGVQRAENVSEHFLCTDVFRGGSGSGPVINY